MLEFILSQAQILALMLSVNASSLVGIDDDYLIPDEQAEQRRLTLQGLEELKQQQLMHVENGVNITNGDLGMMFMALTRPQMLTRITRDVPHKGQQRFWHYRLDPVNVELTLPEEQKYRLAALPDFASSLARIRQILPVEFVETEKIAETLPQDTFFQGKDLAEKGQVEKAATLFQEAGFPLKHAQQFAGVLQAPTLGGTITFLSFVDQEVIDGRDLAVVQDAQAAWAIQQITPGEPILSVTSLTAFEYSQRLLTTANSLVASENNSGD